ncbi:MAG: hypothetical protein U0411_06400 [Thermodesulfovibrionales bacterium]
MSNPVELLSSQRMKELIVEMKARYPDRYIIIDTPPLLPFAETHAISCMVDGVLFVVKEGRPLCRAFPTPWGSCSRAGSSVSSTTVWKRRGRAFRSITTATPGSKRSPRERHRACESFFNFKAKPFELVPNPDFLYLSKAHKKAVTYLDYGIKEKAGFILLTGEVGSGKTTLIRDLVKKLEGGSPSRRSSTRR